MSCRITGITIAGQCRRKISRQRSEAKTERPANRAGADLERVAVDVIQDSQII
jgi:hypothetical protein